MLIRLATSYFARRARAHERDRRQTRKAMFEGLECRQLFSTVVYSQAITTPTTWTAANSPYYLNGQVEIRNGASLTIESGVNVEGSALLFSDDGSGASISATGVTFYNQVSFGTGTTSTPSSFNSNNFNGAVSAFPGFAAALANNVFAASSVIDLPNNPIVSASATLPLIPNVTSYDITGYGVYVRNGGTLTIAAGVNITGNSLAVSDDGTGGSLIATGVTFSNPLTFGAGATSTPSTFNGNTFNLGVTSDANFVAALANNNFAAPSEIVIGDSVVTKSATLPLIPNVTLYDIVGYAIYVRNGATLTIASGVHVTGNYIEISDDGSGGMLDATGVTFANQIIFGTGATSNPSTFNGNTFNGTISAYPGFMTALTSNTFAPSSIIDIPNDPIVSTSATLPLIPNVIAYDISLSAVYVRDGATLTIASGVLVTGANLEISDNGSGGTLDAVGVTLDVSLTFGLGATVTPSTFNGNTIKYAATVYPQFIAALANNTYISSWIDISGYTVLSASMTLPKLPNVKNYDLLGGILVRNGATLTIDPGLTIFGGILDVSDDGSGGALDALDVTFEDEVELYNGSSGALRYDTFSGSSAQLDVDGGTTALMDENNFSNGMVMSMGSGGPINMQNNWWGTTVPSAIAARITDHADIPSLPIVDYSSPLSAAATLPGLIATISAPDVTTTSDSELVTVLYTDTVGGTVNGSTIASNNITVISPGGQTLIDAVLSTNTVDSTTTAIYSATAPGGIWQISDNGTGQATVTAGIVTESNGNANTAAATTFAVAIAGIAPTITLQPTPVSVSAGQMVNFVAAASGSPTPTVQWQYSTDGITYTNVAGATSTTYSFTASAGQNGELFRAVFTNSVSSATTNAVALTVTPALAAPSITLQPTAQLVTAGQSISFTAAANGNPTPTVQWQVSVSGGAFTNIGGATSDTLTLSNVSAGLSGNQYQAVFTNSVGGATTSAVTLTVNTPPTITNQPTPQTVISGSSATFTAAASGNPAPTVQWQVSVSGGAFTNISGATSDTLILSNVSASLGGNQYQAVFTNSVGSATSSAATLTVNTPPTITNQPTPQTVISGGTATFTAAATGLPAPTVQWQVSVSGGAFANISGANSDTLTLSGVTAAMNGNKYQAVFANAAGSATSVAVALTVSAGTSVLTTQPASQTTYIGGSVTFVSGASGSPTPTVQWQLSVNNGAFANISGATKTSLTISNVALTQSGNRYRAIYTNSNGSATSAIATLTVSPAPAITSEPKNATGNFGGSVTLSASAAGSPSPTVQWQVSTNSGAFVNITGATKATLTLSNLTAAMNGNQYRAVFTNAHGAATTTAAILTVNLAPVVSTQPTSKSVTHGSTATFTASATGSPTPTVQWQVSVKGGAYTNIAGATGKTLAVSSTTTTMSGNQYRAVFTNSHGVIDSNAATLTVT